MFSFANMAILVTAAREPKRSGIVKFFLYSHVDASNHSGKIVAQPSIASN